MERSQTRGPVGLLSLGAVGVLALLLTLVCVTGAQLAGGNPIVTENALPGTRSWWATQDPVSHVWQGEAVNHEIEGYASATSVNRGESLTFYVNVADPVND